MVHILSSPASMSNNQLLSSYLALLSLLLFIESCRAKNNSFCITSFCGNISISYPFRLRGDPANCGHPDPVFVLGCQKDQLFLHTESRRYQVQAITYSNFSIRISDPGLDSKNYSSCPIYSYIEDDIDSRYVYHYYPISIFLTFLNCLSPVDNPSYIEYPLCGNTSAFSNSSRVYSYVTAERILVSDLEESCTYDTMTQASSPWPSTYRNYSYTQIHDMLAYGYELVWYRALCTECDERKGTCFLEDNKIRCRHYCYEDTPLEDRTFFCKLEYYAPYLFIAAMAIGGLIALRFILAVSCVIGLAVKKRKRQRAEMYETDNIEELLRLQVNHMPISYSYREIKKMTQNFKTKLGRGPHGTVFKGNLRSGPFVAVKMLMDSSGSDDREFIRHASAISRISNAHVVKNFGFCIQGAKRALVYEFVQRGSLDKLIFLHEGKRHDSLSLGDMFRISVGIARGIQCLHAADIFHLAIKPQNILLDQDHNPKISDSGPKPNSSHYHRIKDMSVEKGKMGFMAPEMLYKNVGEISCKADVYSYGMLVLEMAAGYASKPGEVFFPWWVFRQLCDGKEIEMRDDGEEEREMMKKIIVAGLWCIQTRPDNRPSMNEVVGMLEGGVESLRLPPNPFTDPMQKIF